MKKYFDSKYSKIAMYTIFVVLVSIVAFRLSSSTDNFMTEVTEYFNSFLSMFSSIFAGLAIAYLMNPSMNFFERNLTKKIKLTTQKQYKQIRGLSIGIVYLCVFGGIYLFISFLIPQIVDNVTFFATNAPMYYSKINDMLIQLEISMNEAMIAHFGVVPDYIPTDIVQNLFDMIDVQKLIDIVLNSLNAIFATILTSTVMLTGILFDAIIACFVALYALLQKETFVNGATRLVYAIFKKETAIKILGVSKEGHMMMIRFFVGKALDSLIIGIIFFIGLTILNNPYSLLLALVMGAFNMIPYFGPFIGAVPAVALTLFEGFTPAMTVLVFIIILQQFDGNYLGPKILGDSLGITPFWIISSVTIGGAIAGPLGMFLACPIVALLMLIINRWIDRKLVANDVHLPKLDVDDIVPNPSPPYNK